MKPSFAVLGCGKVGTALATCLIRCGYRLTGITCRTDASAAEAAGVIGEGAYGIQSCEKLAEADVLFIATPDDVIARVCREQAGLGLFRRGQAVLHCSGAHASDLLAPAAGAGASVGTLHPLQSVAVRNPEISPFSGAVMAIEGNREAVAVAEAMARELGGTPLRVRTQGKLLYHAAAVVASNYLVTLMEFAVSLLEAAGIDRKDAFQVLDPLVRGTLANVARQGPVFALTGPIVRGDAETVENHLQAMQRECPDWLPLYAALGEYTIRVTEKRGKLAAEAIDRLRAVLGGPDYL
ncbi:MAG: NADP oxidoreductase [Deltaproteobacteria bacterium]|nr:MAG: NADP oxidoreductase [Deltaproteobacteria bacterium]